jgi:two-component system chemotaxis sensor kinase CheA
MEMSKEDMQALIECFLQESAETVARAESNILRLEANPTDSKSIEEIFRAVHTIKGSSAGVGLSGLASFTHELESLLSQVKKGREVTPALISALLQGLDAIRRWIDEVQKGNKDNVDIEEALHAIKSLDAVEASENTKATPDDDIVFLFSPDTGECLKNPTPMNQLEPAHAQHQQHHQHRQRHPKPAAAHAEPAPPTEDPASDLVTMPMRKIESLLDLFGEQVILHSILENIKNDLVEKEDLAKHTIDQLSKITYNLQNAAMALRMVSLRSFFMKMKRAVRDATVALGKDIHFDVQGEDTELDKHMADKLASFVTHMVRNSVDHGIESAEVRAQAGKNPRGTIVMKAYLHGGFFYLEIVDDGGGINRARVKDKAIRQGLLSADSNPTDEEILQLIFAPGFSTKEQATELSGRGFGMDIAITEIHRMHGSIHVESEEGKSTRFVIRLPLTLAIFNGVVIRSGHDHFVVPSSEVIDFTKLANVETVHLDSMRSIVNIKDQVIPLVPLALALRMNRNAEGTVKIPPQRKTSAPVESQNEVALLVKRNGATHALQVDELVGIRRVVLKNLGKELKDCPAVSGGAILSDGSVALVLETQKVLDLWDACIRAH